MQYCRFFLLISSFIVSLVCSRNAYADTFYISPAGNDDRSGRDFSSAWRSFDRAWESLYPGDTLILLDGIYYQTLNPNVRNGTENAPITVQALNDGGAIIDGEGVRETVRLESWANGPIGSYFVIEGIVARNSSASVYQINFDNNVLRRVSGYNAYTDGNEHVFTITGNNTLLEDCVAAGSGRKMIVIFQGSNNVVRRCFANWQSWDGRDWHDAWPWGDNIQIYNASDNIVENSIAYGPAPVWSISIQANSGDAVAARNKILGSMALNAGMNNDGTVKNWGRNRPQPTEHTEIRDFSWPSQRVGLMLLSAGKFEDNLIQDVVSSGNAGLGLSTLLYGSSTTNNQVVNTTIRRNGLDNPGNYGGVGVEVRSQELGSLTFHDSYVHGSAEHEGSGASIEYRYENGVLTEEPLWPWPMQKRIQDELGLSVNAIAERALNGEGNPTPAPTDVVQRPTTVPTTEPITLPTNTGSTATPLPETATPAAPLATPTATRMESRPTITPSQGPTAVVAVTKSPTATPLWSPTAYSELTVSPTPVSPTPVFSTSQPLVSPTATGSAGGQASTPLLTTPLPTPTATLLVAWTPTTSATPTLFSSPTPTIGATPTPTSATTAIPFLSGAMLKEALYLPLTMP